MDEYLLKKDEAEKDDLMDGHEQAPTCHALILASVLKTCEVSNANFDEHFDGEVMKDVEEDG